MYRTANVVQITEWEQYAWLRHGFSRRQGGVTQIYPQIYTQIYQPDDTSGGSADEGFGALNLGWTRDDATAAIVENRRRFMEVVGRAQGEDSDFKLVTVRQVHGVSVQPVREEDGVGGRLATADGRAVLEGDGLITDIAGVMLGIQTADCVPVLVADVRRRVVAAFHAGWRGTAARIVEHGIAALVRDYGTRTEDLVAAVGPSIGVCCYEVGDEVRGEFERGFSYARELFQGRRLNLWEANRRQLLAAGMGAKTISTVAECTACSRDREGRRLYFSHRAEKGFTGRMLSAIGVAKVQ